ncbi:MAG: chitobiase/beta-hexosaminidase C-terminal domain-containing protein [Bacteroides sp.]|nr:chitobiase/beta-hexosaminidase C-terminal domain-containing protein [Bacteroides sp.]
MSLYKKVEAAPACGAVTNVEVNAQQTTATITWTAPDPEPEDGYLVYAEASASDFKLIDVKKGDKQVQLTGLTPATKYSYEIQSICDGNSDLKSEKVTGTFNTLGADAPSLTITSPESGAIFSGDVTLTFTTANFELDDSKLVKVEVKKGDKDAPIIRTSYAKASPVVISGLENGNYHVDLKLANVSGADTTEVADVLGHRDIVVKLPYVAFATKELSIKTYLNVDATAKVAVTGWGLADNAEVSLASNNSSFFVEPATLTKAAVTAEGGAEVTITYDGYASSAQATITASCGDLSAELTVKGTANETVYNLKGLYNYNNKGKEMMVKGKMVVTHKDDFNNRIWVQDIEKEDGASMLLYKAADGYADIKVGDVLENVAGKVDIFNNLYEFLPIGKLVAVESNHAVYVDTLTVDYINKNIATVQNAMVCVENVTFTAGKFATTNTDARKLTLNQGSDKLEFYTTFNNADYVGENTPGGRLNVTGILGNASGKAQITARSKADMVEAPCTLPSNFNVNARSFEVTINWEGLADKYSVRYATTEEGLATATAAEVNSAVFSAKDLTPETKYYFQVKSLCSATSESDWSAAQTFTTLSAHAPTIRLDSPEREQVFTDTVKVAVYVRNVQNLTLEDTCIRVMLSNGDTLYSADTMVKRALPTGNYEVVVGLVKKQANGKYDTLTPRVSTVSRPFSVDLPDVAAPTFTPAAGTYGEHVEVALTSTTPGAVIYYTTDGSTPTAQSTLYTEAFTVSTNTTVKAIACKERMDTSAVATAEYKFRTIDKDVVFFEDFTAFADTTTWSTKSFAGWKDVTDEQGWTGENVYPGMGGVKMGGGSSLGWIATRALDLSEGAYELSFLAGAWDNAKESTSINVVVGEQTIAVEDLPKLATTSRDGFKAYSYILSGKTDATSIKFTALKKSNNRFMLDSVCIKKVAADQPILTVAETVSLSTTLGTAVEKSVSVSGLNLTADVTLSCPTGNFSVAPATLTKESVMGEGGAEFKITYNGTKASDAVDITVASGNLTKTVKVTATAVEVVEVDDIAALRAGKLESTTYKVKGEVVVTAVDGISTWVQDASAAIQIYGQTGNTYKVGDGITGIYGTLKNYSDLIELLPEGDQPAATTHDNAVEPQVMTVEELKEKGADYSSRLIRINGLTLGETEETAWKGSQSYTATDEAGNELTIRTTITQGSYIGETLPEGKFDLIAIAGIFKGTVQVSPRVKTDIVAEGGDDPDECAAPTSLKVTIDNEAETATASWKGAASEYKVVLLAVNNSKDTVEQLAVKTKSYTFKAVKANVEYAWAVASVCEDGDHWTKGQNFTIKKVANEGMDRIVAGIYPNPTDGLVYVELTESARMEIFTVGGLVIRTAELTAGKNEVMLNQSGIYFIRLSNAKGSIVKRVVVR